MTSGQQLTGHGNSFANREDSTVTKLIRLSIEHSPPSNGQLADLSTLEAINLLMMATLYTGQSEKMLTTMG
jgi:hypothetical protein